MRLICEIEASMTPEKNREIRLVAMAAAGRRVTLLAAGSIRDALPPPGSPERTARLKSLESLLSRQRAEIAMVVFPEMNPAESDLWAGEALDAFDALASEFLKALE